MDSIATAPGKAILFGEHAVVHGSPAIAIPLSSVRATAQITSLPGTEIKIAAKDINLEILLSKLEAKHPLRFAIELFFNKFSNIMKSGMSINLHSDIPIASGMGSGAAISAALFKALFQFFNRSFTKAELSKLVYEVEKLHHGTPSGIDNTVVCYEKPVLFRKGHEIQMIDFLHPFDLVIANSGFSTPTIETVRDVRRLYENEPQKTRILFDHITRCSHEGMKFLQDGDLQKAGNTMTTNHNLLQQLTVSHEKLDLIVNAANQAGAYGAKLSGGGRGGIVIALVDQNKIGLVTDAMQKAGAVQCFHTQIETES